MAKVSFYTHIANYDQFACKLVKTVFLKKESLLVLTENQQQAYTFDQKLWQFEDESFIPHQVMTEASDELAERIVIAYEEIQGQINSKNILNLSKQVVTYSHFERVLELVEQTEEAMDAARERYKMYKNAGFEIEYFNMELKS